MSEDEGANLILGMAADKEIYPKGPYTLWRYEGYGRWYFEDFPTIEAALRADKWGSTWHISKPVSFRIEEEGGE